jgi:hypothetical protein
VLALFQALAVAAAGHSAGPAAPVVYAKPKTTGVLAEFVSLVTRAATAQYASAHHGALSPQVCSRSSSHS